MLSTSRITQDILGLVEGQAHSLDVQDDALAALAAPLSPPQHSSGPTVTISDDRLKQRVQEFADKYRVPQGIAAREVAFANTLRAATRMCTMRAAALTFFNLSHTCHYISAALAMAPQSLRLRSARSLRGGTFQACLPGYRHG